MFRSCAVADATFQEILLDAGAEAGPGARAARGARLPSFLGAQGVPDAVLDALRVAVIGLGSVGRNIALHLARLMIASLWLVDPGRFKAESLLTQPIGPADVAEPKASNAGRLCKQISPRTRVFALDGPVQSLNALALADADVVLLATDNLAAEVDVGQRCLHLARPLAQASVHGATLLAQVRLFANRDASGPCPACLFGPLEWGHLNRETTFSCQGAGHDGTVGRVAAPPTMSTSFLCALAADLALVQVCRHLLRLGAPVADTLVEYCGYTHRVVTSPLVRNANCPCDHQRWNELPAPRPLGDCSLRDLAAAAGFSGPAGLSFNAADLTYAEQGACNSCGLLQPLRRLVAVEQPRPGRCHTCGSPVLPHPFYSYRPIPAGVALPVWQQPLGQLGEQPPAWVVVGGEGRAVLFRQPASGKESMA
jgi:molybdopterin/thiamine biosynthesis adenylyltransferase